MGRHLNRYISKRTNNNIRAASRNGEQRNHLIQWLDASEMMWNLGTSPAARIHSVCNFTFLHCAFLIISTILQLTSNPWHAITRLTTYSTRQIKRRDDVNFRDDKNLLNETINEINSVNNFSYLAFRNFIKFCNRRTHQWTTFCDIPSHAVREVAHQNTRKFASAKWPRTIGERVDSEPTDHDFRRPESA